MDRLLDEKQRNDLFIPVSGFDGKRYVCRRTHGMIKTENLTKVYNGVTAVNSINIEVGKGQVCGFVGSNGAGKTTTLGMMIGLIQPTEGKCFIKNIEVSRHPLAVKQIIGYLPDGVGFYHRMNAVQNLRFLSKFYGLNDADANRRISELLEYVGLAKVVKKVGTYSKGMKQRLGLARTLLNDPEVIFLDEPTNGLDPEGVIQFRNIVKEQAAADKTVFFPRTCSMRCSTYAIPFASSRKVGSWLKGRWKTSVKVSARNNASQ